MPCPFCGRPAISQHHIVPRSEGGNDHKRNIVWLCKSCHDEIEGIPFTPELLAQKRRDKLGSTIIESEVYVFLAHPDGELFIGIRKGKEIILPFHIFFPYNAQTQMPLESASSKAWKHTTYSSQLSPSQREVSKHRKRGRPCALLPPEATLLLGDITLSSREIAQKLGVSYRTICRRIKERQPKDYPYLTG